MSIELTAPVAAEHRTVSRVMGIIEAVAASEPVGLRLAELAGAVSAPKSSVHGLAKGLVALGYLHEYEGRYLIGPAIPLLVTANTEERRQRSITDQLRALCEKWNETAMAGMLVGDSAVYTQSVESTHTLRAAVPLHSRVQLWPGSSGKCMLAFMPVRRRDAYFDRVGIQGAERDKIYDELEQIRNNRVALNLGGTAVGMFGVAAPIVTPGKPVTETIAVTGPEVRLSGKLDELAEDVRRAGLILSGAAG